MTVENGPADVKFEQLEPASLIEFGLDIIPLYRYNRFMYTVNEASKHLNLDPSQVRRLLRSGDIKGQKFGRDWMVLDLDYKRKRTPGGGRKPKQQREE